MTEIEFDGVELLALAQFDIDNKRLDKALIKIKQALLLSDFPSEIYVLGARLYAQLGLYRQAKDFFKQYLVQNPENVTVHFQLGMATLDSGDHTEALNIWQKLLAEYPTHPPTLYYSSLALVDTEQLDSAKRNIEILLKSAPVNNLYFEKGKELLNAINSNPKNAGNALRTKSSAYISEN